jgi:methyl-accepting chemotaxis protein
MVDGALAAIAGDVGAVHALLQAMATDNQAQALAVTEIAAAVASMDQSTQQNAAMVELTASAARALNGNVNTLVEKAEIFKFERRTRSTAVSVERRSGTLAGAITTRALPPLSAASHASANDRHRGQAVAAE